MRTSEMILPNPMLDDRDWQRLARYVAGESTGDEAESTRAWLESDAARRELHARMQEVWELARVNESRWDARRSWDRMSMRLELAEKSPEPSRHSREDRHSREGGNPFK